jgi:hypothetical protein
LGSGGGRAPRPFDLGDKSFESRHERGLRVGEEGIETAQACGATREELHTLIDMVCDKPRGELLQVVGGAMFTLLSICANLGLRLDDLYNREIARFKQKDANHLRDEEAIKAKLGVSLNLR